MRNSAFPAWSVAAISALVLGAVGCANVVAQNAPAALRTAERRGQFELDCPQATATILSQKAVEGLRFEGAEYTIGVRGCGRQEVYVTYCRDQTDCNAVAQGGRIQPAGGEHKRLP